MVWRHNHSVGKGKVLTDPMREFRTVPCDNESCILFQERQHGGICVLKRSLWLWRGKWTGWRETKDGETKEEGVAIKQKREMMIRLDHGGGGEAGKEGSDVRAVYSK